MDHEMWLVEGSADDAQMLDDSEREEGEERHFERAAVTTGEGAAPAEASAAATSAGARTDAPHAPATSHHTMHPRTLDAARPTPHAMQRRTHTTRHVTRHPRTCAPPRSALPHVDRPDRRRGQAPGPHVQARSAAATAHHQRPRRELPLGPRGTPARVEDASLPAPTPTLARRACLGRWRGRSGSSWSSSWSRT